MPGEPLLIDHQGACLRLTINRPEKRNALSLALLDDIGVTLAAHAADAGLRCAVVTAAGDQCFAAGGDLQELDAIRSDADAQAMSRRGRRALDEVRSFPVPVVAVLNGPALGGGAELALACDFRVMALHAEIGFLQSQLGVTTAWGGGIDLAATVGDRRALAILATSRRIGAAEAGQLGLADRVCGPEETLEVCLASFLDAFLSRSRPVLIGIKSLASASRRRLHAELTAVEEEHFIRTWTHPDHWVAVRKALPSKPG